MLVEACEEGGSQFKDVTALKANVAGLRCNVEELKSTDLWMFFNTVTLPEVPSIVMPCIFQIPLYTATKDVILADNNDESASETDEKELGTRDAVVYDDLEDLKSAMVQKVMEAALRDSSMIGIT